MHALGFVFAIGWAAFWIYWLAVAFSTKRSHIPWRRELQIRALFLLVVILLVRLGAFRNHVLRTDLWRAGVGLILLSVGLGLAIWARVHIGRDWGGPMTQKDDPHLVTSGPYHWVRHPIYTGILTAGAGTALALNWNWLLAVALAAVFCLQRDGRGTTPEPAVPRHLQRVQALDQDAHPLHLLARDTSSSAAERLYGSSRAQGGYARPMRPVTGGSALASRPETCRELGPSAAAGTERSHRPRLPRGAWLEVGAGDQGAAVLVDMSRPPFADQRCIVTASGRPFAVHARPDWGAVRTITRMMLPPMLLCRVCDTVVGLPGSS